MPGARGSMIVAILLRSSIGLGRANDFAPPIDKAGAVSVISMCFRLA